MKIILLGATGFAGANIAQVLNQNEVTFYSLSKNNNVDLMN